MPHVQLKISGYLVGQIWMPATECWKELSYDVTQESKRIVGGKVTLRDHVLRATNDGDFQDCVIACGELIATRRSNKNGRTVTVERRFPLDLFPGIADMLHDDPDWCPTWDDESEFA